MNFDIPTFNNLWDDPVFKNYQNTDFEGERYLHFDIKESNNLLDLSFEEKILESWKVNSSSTTSELEKFVDKFYENVYELPKYYVPGRILFQIYDISDDPSKPEWEFEILDWDKETGIYWINEGEGFDYWLNNRFDFTEEGKYLIENIVGHYTKGTWGFDDDWEEWNSNDPIKTDLEKLP